MTSVDRIQGLSGSLGVKAPVRVATTAAITLAGLQTVDSIALASGDRVLVKDQASATANGIYDASTAGWTRSLDCDGINDMVNGTLIPVAEGSTNSGRMFKLTATDPVVPGTTSMSFSANIVFGSYPLGISLGGTGAATAAAAMAALGDARGSVVMHATNMDIWGPYNVYDGTGSAADLTDVATPPQAGARRTLYPIGGSTIAHGGRFAVDGAAKVTAATGDAWEFEAVTTSLINIHITRYSGAPAAPVALAAKTTAYTLVNGDSGKTIALGGSASYALTVGVVGGFDATFKARIKNTDTARAKKMTINGITDFWLWPGQFIDLYISGGAWQVDGAPARWVTQNAGVTFYVSHAAGSNNNDGLAAGAGNALATIQEAIYRIEKYIDCAGNGPTIQVADGTFTEDDVSHTKRIHGNHVIYIAGNVTTPGNCVWQMTAGHSGLTCRDWSGVIVAGFKFVALGVGCTALSASQHGVVDIGAIEFGDMTGGVCVASDNGGSIGYTVGATSKFLGNASVLWAVTTGSNLIVTGCTINLSAITFTTGLSHTGGCSTWAGVTFTGAGAGGGSTGIKYGVTYNGLAILNGLTLPGASAGTTATGGQVSP